MIIRGTTIFMQYFILFATLLQITIGIILPEPCPFSPQFGLGTVIQYNFIVKKIPLEITQKPYILLNPIDKICINIYYAKSPTEILFALIHKFSAKDMECISGFTGIYETAENDFFFVRDSQLQDPPVCVKGYMNIDLLNVFSDDQGELIWSCYDDGENQNGLDEHPHQWAFKNSSVTTDAITLEFGQRFTQMLVMAHKVLKKDINFEDIFSATTPFKGIDSYCKPAKKCLIYYCTKPINITQQIIDKSCNEQLVIYTATGIIITLIVVFLLQTIFLQNRGQNANKIKFLQ